MTAFIFGEPAASCSGSSIGNIYLFPALVLRAGFAF